MNIEKDRELGVGPEVLVGLCVERSLEMVIAMLGILRDWESIDQQEGTNPQSPIKQIAHIAPKC